ncbi:MAG: alpha/beta hydrolase [Actinobacteria bacterium]|nr:alpha/beta hydrolase [Actinomycetota bacterium]
MQIDSITIPTSELTYGCLTAGDSGPLALCLHGFPDTAHGWRYLLPALADAGYRAVAPFMRGYAPTSMRPLPLIVGDELSPQQSHQLRRWRRR